MLSESNPDYFGHHCSELKMAEKTTDAEPELAEETQSQDLFNFSPQSDHENESSESDIEISRNKRALWTDAMMRDLTDIVVNTPIYRKRLIFTNNKKQQNTKTYKDVLGEFNERHPDVQLTPNQIRNKFKKMISICKAAALKIKTASGIKRFQDDKQFGEWFNMLYPVVKTRESCQPELAIEPSATAFTEGEPTPNPHVEESTSAENVFTPTREKSRNKRNKRQAMVEKISDCIDAIKESLTHDPIKEMMEFMAEESRKSREHEMKLLEILTRSNANSNGHFSQATNAMYNSQSQNTSRASTSSNRNIFHDITNGASYYQM